MKGGKECKPCQHEHPNNPVLGLHEPIERMLGSLKRFGRWSLEVKQLGQGNWQCVLARMPYCYDMQ